MPKTEFHYRVIINDVYEGLICAGLFETLSAASSALDSYYDITPEGDYILHDSVKDVWIEEF